MAIVEWVVIASLQISLWTGSLILAKNLLAQTAADSWAMHWARTSLSNGRGQVGRARVEVARATARATIRLPK